MLVKDYIKKHGNAHFQSVLTKEGKQKLSYPNWIIADTRFPNEFKAIKERGGLMLKVVRTEKDSAGNRVLSNHIRSEIHSSETALEGYEFDHIIFNDDGILELAHKVKKILIKEGFLV